MSQTKAQLVSGTTAQDLTVDNINTSSINSGKTAGRKNLVINGAMNIAQRGTSSSQTGYRTVDRFRPDAGGTDETPTQAQVDVASGTGPYESGFRKALKITNGNQTGGAAAADFVQIDYRFEAQDIAKSGWNYTSSSSFVTLSFWIKSSVSKDFQIVVRTQDGTSQSFQFETPTLSADTWTKVTKTIPGNSNLTFDNNTDIGLLLFWFPYIGTEYTDAGNTLDAWQTSSSSTYGVVDGTSWYTTNDATFEITGVQLETGSTATDFEHRSFGEDLALCQRYFFSITGDNNVRSGVLGYANSSSEFRGVVHFPVTMRANPTLTGSATAAVIDSADDSATFNVNALSMSTVPQINQAVVEVSTSSMTAGQCGQLEFRASNGFMNFDAEI